MRVHHRFLAGPVGDAEHAHLVIFEVHFVVFRVYFHRVGDRLGFRSRRHVCFLRSKGSRFPGEEQSMVLLPQKNKPTRRTISPVFSDFRAPVQTRKLICQINFAPATFRGSAHLKSMRTKTLQVTAASFEKVYAAIATERTLSRRSRSGKIARDLADWRELA